MSDSPQNPIFVYMPYTYGMQQNESPTTINRGWGGKLYAWKLYARRGYHLSDFSACQIELVGLSCGFLGATITSWKCKDEEMLFVR